MKPCLYFFTYGNNILLHVHQLIYQYNTNTQKYLCKWPWCNCPLHIHLVPVPCLTNCLPLGDLHGRLYCLSMIVMWPINHQIDFRGYFSGHIFFTLVDKDKLYCSKLHWHISLYKKWQGCMTWNPPHQWGLKLCFLSSCNV